MAVADDPETDCGNDAAPDHDLAVLFPSHFQTASVCFMLLLVCVLLGSPVDSIFTDKFVCRKANLILAGFIHNHIK